MTLGVLDYTLLASLAALTYSAWWGWKCRCEKCAYHVNEYRMERHRAEERAHDAEHKGFGYRDDSPDLYACKDADCSRNPRPKG